MAYGMFISGTDTGVGKTICTALLLLRLQQHGAKALAVKPVCSGGVEDLDLLAALQPDCACPEDLNLWRFKAPLAPWLAAQREKKTIQPQRLLRKIKDWAAGRDWLLVEGAGGLCVPLTRRCSILDLIHNLNMPVVLVAPNRLGVLNHVLLSLRALTSVLKAPVQVVLMEQAIQDPASVSNLSALRKLAPSIPIETLPMLGVGPFTKTQLDRAADQLKEPLDRMLSRAQICPGNRQRNQKRKYS